MVEVCQSPDGRIAVHTPATVDTVQKGECNWLAISWPEGVLHVELLTDIDVRDWTRLTPSALRKPSDHE